nr:MAG: nucleotide pyrophosphohydrolase, MazG-like [uncultured archaeon]
MDLDDLIDEVDEFADEMIEILEEKTEKYKDITWEMVTIDTLKAKMTDQITALDYYIKRGLAKEKHFARRKLIHIANYCFFLYNRLGK